MNTSPSFSVKSWIDEATNAPVSNTELSDTFYGKVAVTF